MNHNEHAVEIPVDLLRTGLHVHALDRPWVETPFIFQGFRITGEVEIDTLRAYCTRVQVDLAQSEPSAAETVMAAGQRRPVSAEQIGAHAPLSERRLPEALQCCTGALFEPVAHPDRDRFSRLVRAASNVREAAAQAVQDALQRMQRNHSIDITQATRAVDQMVRLIREDATASLWLSRLQRQRGYLADHAANSCAIALAFGAHLGMDSRPLQRLGLGTLLMDVGMIGVPDEILSKERPLSSTERASMRRHVETGCERLAHAGLPAESLAIVRQHHERIDGRGYPDGAGGDALPRQILIAGLADSYDAMTVDRPYRSAFRPDQALQEIYRSADETFGGDLIESFIRCVGTWPVGSLVQLDNDAIGVVVASRPGAGAWPTVLMLRTPDGTPYRKRLLLNLAAGERGDHQVDARRIRRALGQREANVDVAKVVAREFGRGRLINERQTGQQSATVAESRVA